MRAGLRSSHTPRLRRTPPSAVSGMLLSVLVDGSVCTPPTTVCVVVVLCEPVCVVCMVAVVVGAVSTPLTAVVVVDEVVPVIALVVVLRFAFAWIARFAAVPTLAAAC